MHEPQLDHANTTTLGRQARYAVTVSVANSPSGRKSSLVLGLDEHDGGVLKHVFERLEEPGGHGAVDDAMIAR